MARIAGLGGIFVKARDPAALQAWYRDVLGIDVQSWGGAQLWNDPPKGKTRTYGVWAAFGPDTSYFEPSPRDFMINLRVDDLDGMLAQVKERGGNVMPKREETEDGRYGYVLDPEGVLLELWQPPELL
jgi:predicted enzyme related to lactoylglutathione lyase